MDETQRQSRRSKAAGPGGADPEAARLACDGMAGTGDGARAATRRPRLLYLASSFPYGRNDTFFGPEVRELVRQGTHVRAVPIRPRGPLTTIDAESLTVRKPLLDRQIAAAAVAEFVRSPRLVLQALGLLLRSPRPNVLLRNLAAFPKALWLARLARDWTADHIHAHWAGPPSTVALVAARLSGVPWSFTAHATEIYAGNLLPEKCRSARFVRFVAAAMMERARTVAPDLDDSRWVLVRLGVEVPEPPAPPPSNDPPVVLLAASFVRGKGHEVVLAAAERLVEDGRRFEVWLAGAGPLEAELQARARDLRLDGVARFCGYVPNAELLQWMESRRIDLVVLASDSEGVPVSLMEALARGVPAVATDVGGVAELLGEGCGVLVPPQDPEALADGIARLLDSPELRLACARAGRARIEEEFAVASAVRRLRALMGFAAG